MKIQDAINRTTNLLATSIAALAGIAFLPEAFVEDKEIFKLDDALLFWVGIAAIIWYKWKGNSIKRSISPIMFVWLGLLVKVMGFVIELHEKDDLGDDIGGVILFILAAALVTWIYIKAKKLLASK